MSESLVSFAVFGKPEPRGSKSSRVIYANPKTKLPKRRPDGSILSVVFDTNDHDSKKWMAKVDVAARSVWRADPIEGLALEVELVFFLARPEGHFGSGRNVRMVKDSAPARPAVYPDADKLGRGTLDAITGIVWKNDSQLVRVVTEKRYAVPRSASDDGLGVIVEVRSCGQQRAADLEQNLRERWVAGETAPLPSLQGTLV